MPRLPGGDIYPSILSLDSRPDPRADSNTFSNFSLRLGEVQEIVYPSDTRSRSKKLVEYRVLVQERSNGTGMGRMYEGCLLMNGFGSFADYVTYTLRVDPNQKSSSGLGLGSKVLILCVNGEQNSAFIVGGVRDQTDSRDQNVDDSMGTYWFASFNGVTGNVNGDGEFTLTYTGKMKVDGKRDDSVKDNQIGTFLSLTKDGNANLSDKDGKNSLLIDHANSKVVIKRDTAFELGDATDYMLLGQTFRQNQQTLNNKLSAQIKTASNLLQQAATQILAAGAATPAPGAPIPGLQAAGPLLLSAAQALAQASQAITDFEQAAGQKNSFLSKKNKSD